MPSAADFGFPNVEYGTPDYKRYIKKRSVFISKRAKQEALEQAALKQGTLEQEVVNKAKIIPNVITKPQRYTKGISQETREMNDYMKLVKDLKNITNNETYKQDYDKVLQKSKKQILSKEEKDFLNQYKQEFGSEGMTRGKISSEPGDNRLRYKYK